LEVNPCATNHAGIRFAKRLLHNQHLFPRDPSHRFLLFTYQCLPSIQTLNSVLLRPRSKMSSPHCELCRKSFKTLFALQNHEKDSPAHMTHHCEQCQKSFQSQAALSQHTKTSRRHKTGRQVPPSQQTTEVKVQPTKAIRQSLPKTAVPKPGSSQAVIYAERCLQPKAPKLKELKSTTTGALNVAKSVTTNSPGPLSPWAVIPKFSYTTVFNTLSEHCHSPEDLKSNGFILDLYDPLTSIFKPGKCRNCNGQLKTQFPNLIDELS
jgi:hypothetical protein